ncbi:hypothetical protein NA57DRAFT_39036 [Rhizodiscina lignyota]|uniref:J domain-containing protein n=1 Tax=Rhizodiscina lignyota TaxID=1504668 RepID=A0A9P4M674_9PEZI|nr:hypothetical protein NA57DRAFT_39036 [Rhizodiscina lignyota]
MRLFTTVSVLLAAFATVTIAWDKEDHEIFRIRDDLSALEGPSVSFYDFIGTTPSASQDDINKAYRKKSRIIHPDKARQSFISTYGKSAEKAKDKKKKPGVQVRKQPTQREVDKFTKEATHKYQLLTTVANVLRGPGRERYDHFLRNGFPTWRGTGYYYTRYRPGLGTVLAGLFVFGGGLVHYGVLVLSHKRQRDFVDRYIRHARRMAWGDDLGIQGIPGGSNGSASVSRTESPAPQAPQGDGDDEQAPVPRNRKERRAMEKDSRKKEKNPSRTAARAAVAAKNSGVSTPQDAELTSGPVGTKKRVVAENGKVLIVDSVGNVYLEEETEEGSTHEFLLDPDEIPRPTIYDTAVFRVPIWAYNKTVGRITGKPTIEEILEENADEQDGEGEVDDAVSAALASNANGEARRRKAKYRQK